MKILLTGATGYIAKRLLPILISKGHEVVCCVRDRQRFDFSLYDSDNISVIEVDFLEKDTLKNIPDDIDVAFYLIHSMSSSIGKFDVLEQESAVNFRDYMNNTSVKQVIYLSGIVNHEKLSKHLYSRKAVEEILKNGSYHLTTLRAGIIVGSGSASFEMIRDLVEKFPVLIAPKCINTKTQPIAIRNVLHYMENVMLNEKTYDKSFDIGGPDILRYKDMLLQFSEVRGLKRRVLVVPFFSARIASYMLFFITSTSYKLAANLLDSMKVEVICGENNLNKIIKIELFSYKEAVRLAFEKIKQESVVSSWTDAVLGSKLEKGISKFINTPTHGCFKNRRSIAVSDESAVLKRIWSIGGKTGWYHASWIWRIRGIIDKMFGGVGLRRGRRSKNKLYAGDSLDFWRVLLADKKEKRLLLYAEMKQPGEAWLEFKIKDNILYQTLTFRPVGLLGRIYWLITFLFIVFLFKGMIKKIAKTE